MADQKKFATRAIHAGQAPDPSTGAIMPPIYATSTYVQESPGVHKGYEYSRTQNPTRMAYERCIADLESGSHGFAFASGMAATATILELLDTGSHVVAMDDLYGGTRKKSGALVVVDNTFATPCLQRPLELGCDIIMHSATKFISGHSDMVGGVVVVADDDLAERLAYLQNSIGAIAGPFDSFLALRGVKTLDVRMARSCSNAQAIAAWLEEHDKVEHVIYPGLESHPAHELARRQMPGFGAIVTFFVKGELDDARGFLERCEVFSLAESLGGVESLVDHPAIMTHASVPAAERAKLGISDTLVRLSVGIEDLDDLIADLDRALGA
ncbi:MAG: PLP-dependent transferase [Woeseiaceae bacterium]